MSIGAMQSNTNIKMRLKNIIRRRKRKKKQKKETEIGYIKKLNNINFSIGIVIFIMAGGTLVITEQYYENSSCFHQFYGRLLSTERVLCIFFFFFHLQFISFTKRTAKIEEKNGL